MYQKVKQKIDEADDEHFLIVWIDSPDFPYAILQLTEEKVIVSLLDDGPVLGNNEKEFLSTEATYWKILSLASKETPERLFV